MGKINGCLKRFFISLNIMSAIDGCVLIYGAIQSSAISHQFSAVGTPVLNWLLAISVLGISCLGIYAGFSEKEIILKIFAGFMGVRMIIILIFGIIMDVRRNKVLSGPDQDDAEIAMAVCFRHAVTALLGLLLSLLMIRQVRRHDSPGETSVAMRGY